MRFEKFTLAKYGHFDGASLHFEKSGEADLHLVHGPNEAGKTVFRQALSDFLFGFPQRSYANFRHEYGDLLLEAAVQDGGSPLLLRRVKARKHSLRDSSDSPANESELAAMLRGVDRERFGIEFAIDQAALHSGTKALTADSNRFADTLHAAASGFDAARKLLVDQERMRDEAWDRHPGKTTRAREADQRRKAHKEILNKESVDPARIEEALNARAAAEAGHSRLQAGKAACAAELQRLASMERAGKALGKLDQLQERLRGEEQSRSVEHASLLADAAAIEDLAGSVAAVRNDRSDLEQIEHESAQCEQEILRMAGALGWKASAAKDVQDSFPPDRAIEDLARIANERRDREIELRAKRDQLADNLAQAQRELAEGGARLETMKGVLSPWKGALVQLAEQRFPSPEEAENAAAELSELERAAAACGQKVESAQEQQREAQAAENATAAEAAGVGKKELADARAEREGMFEQLLAADDPQRMAGAYRSKVADADRLADQRFDRAVEAVETDERRRLLARLPAEIAELAKHAEAAQEEVQACAAQWAVRMRACGLEGLQLAQYAAWHRACDGAVSLVGDAAACEARIKQYEDQLKQVQDPDDGEQEHFARLLESCRIPLKTGLTAVQSRLGELQDLSRLLEASRGHADGMAGKRKRIGSFEGRVAQLATRLKQDLADRMAEDASESMSSMLAQARAAEGRIEQAKREAESMREQIADIEEGRSEAEWRKELASSPPEKRAQRKAELEQRAQELEAEYDAAVQKLQLARQAEEHLQDAGASQAAAAQGLQDAVADMAEVVRAHIRHAVGALLLREALERYRVENEPQLMQDAARHLSLLTGGRYARLDYDEERKALLAAEAASGRRLSMQELSAGTVDQAFLALRLAGVLGSIGSGLALPFVADDLFANFDDGRAHAGFALLAQIARKTQVICLTHHEHLIDIARDAAPSINVQRLPEPGTAA